MRSAQEQDVGDRADDGVSMIVARGVWDGLVAGLVVVFCVRDASFEKLTPALLLAVHVAVWTASGLLVWSLAVLRGFPLARRCALIVVACALAAGFVVGLGVPASAAARTEGVAAVGFCVGEAMWRALRRLLSARRGAAGRRDGDDS